MTTFELSCVFLAAGAKATDNVNKGRRVSERVLQPEGDADTRRKARGKPEQKSELRALTQSASPPLEWAGKDKGEIAQRPSNHSGGGESNCVREGEERGLQNNRAGRGGWGHGAGFASGCHVATLPSSLSNIREGGGGSVRDVTIQKHKTILIRTSVHVYVWV